MIELKHLAIAAALVMPATGSVPAKGTQPPEPAKSVPGAVSGAATPSTKPITQDFGAKNPKLYGNGSHDGLDIGNGCGEAVKSPTNGRVTGLGSNPIYGDHAWITGYDGAQHLLGHTDTSVGVGVSVAKGTVIGHTNLSGKTTGCHLHWTVKRDGQIIDPKKWQAEPEVCPQLSNVPARWGVPICAASIKYGADPSLVAAIIWVENRGWPATDKFVCSGAGACGVAQFMPKTWEAYKPRPDATRESWSDSIEGAANYLAKMKKDWRDSAITYNCGPSCIGKTLPRETQQYVELVAQKYREFSIGG